MMYNVVKHVILDKIKPSVLFKTIYKPIDQCHEDSKANEALCQRWPSNDVLLASIRSFLQTQIMDAITEKRRDDIFASKSTIAKKNVAVAAKASPERKALARTSSLSSIEASWKGLSSHQAL